MKVLILYSNSKNGDNKEKYYSKFVFLRKCYMAKIVYFAYVHF